MPLIAASIRRRSVPAALAFLLVSSTACVNQIGITCPPDDPGCDQPDLSATADLQSPPDLTHPDLWECKNACIDGCCDRLGCQMPSVAACGASGATCMRCDTVVADGCRSGKCSCGTNPACYSGQRCLAGKCTCDSTSCPNGCCDPSTGKCYPLDTQHCTNGPGGSLCAKTCDFTADGCLLNTGCVCGKNAPCAAGLRCSNGACVCDGKSCPNGCCLKDTCQPGNVFTACGSGGNTCKTCQNTDICVFNSCVQIPCAQGQIYCTNPQNGAPKCGTDCNNCGNLVYLCPGGACVENCRNCPNATAGCVTNMVNKTCVKDCQLCGGACTP